MSARPHLAARKGTKSTHAANAAASQQCLDETRACAHAHCIACGTLNGGSARLRFSVPEGGGVHACFNASAVYPGYAGMLHGGIIATLLDAAMTNCLFAHGRVGVTADLHLRYRHPVGTDGSCVVRAWIERASSPLFVMRAELWQDSQLRVTATGKFMESPGIAARPTSHGP